MNISRVGYTRCPGCLCHVKVVDAQTECPFCGDELGDAEVLGAGALEKLRSSRTALIAMGLAGGVSLAVACGDNEASNKKGPFGGGEQSNISADYGGFDEDFGINNIDPGVDMGSDAAGDSGSADASSADAGSEDAASDTNAD